MRATGVGSMPGDDFIESLKVVRGLLPDLLFIPELPARGVHAGMIGRSLALLAGLSADLQPAGWRLLDAPGADLRRAQSLLAQDLDAVEEHWHDVEHTVKQQLTGPWTLAATVELQRGEKVVADHGARRDLAESLAAGLTDHLVSLRRRLPQASIVVQIDEPALPAVLQAAIPTASGFGRYRTVHPPEVDAGLRAVVDAVRAAGATPVLHSCAGDLPVGLIAGAGFEAISFDLSLARPDDAWAEAFESGVDVWPGLIPSTDATFDDADSLRRFAAWMDRLGFGEGSWHDRVVLTPTCGLAGATPAHARRALSALADIVGA